MELLNIVYLVCYSTIYSIIPLNIIVNIYLFLSIKKLG